VEVAARNQVLFRQVNERIAELTGMHDFAVSLFICECSDETCAESIEVAFAEYKAVRANGARFVVIPGHQSPEVERVVDGNGRYLVVEKIGAAAEIAGHADPRRG
jgi:hypothetical protein